MKWLILLLLATAACGQATRPAFAPAPKQIEEPPWPAGDITAKLMGMQSNRHYHGLHGAKYTYNAKAPLPAVDNVTITGDDNALAITMPPGPGTAINAVRTTRFAMNGFWITVPLAANVFSPGVADRFGPCVICSTCTHWFVATYPTGNYSVCDGLSGQGNVITISQGYMNVGCDDVWLMNCTMVQSLDEDQARRIVGNTPPGEKPIPVDVNSDKPPQGHMPQRWHVWNNTFAGFSGAGKAGVSDRWGEGLDLQWNHFKGPYIRVGEATLRFPASSHFYIAHNTFQPVKTLSNSQPITDIDVKCLNDGGVIEHNWFNADRRSQLVASTGKDASVFKSLDGNIKHSVDGSTLKPMVAFWQSGVHSDGTNTLVK